MSQKNQLSDNEIKKALISGGKYIIVNLMTSLLILAMVFVISVIIGVETESGTAFFKSSIFQTIMLPLIVWYYAYLAYNDGYKHSVAGTYNKRKIIMTALPMFIVQMIFVIIAISQGSSENIGFAKTVSLFLLSPFTVLFDALPDFMPEIMVIPCFIPPAAMYVGYYLAHFKEIKDHSMNDDAKKFREELEATQYDRNNSDGDKQ